MFFTPPLMVHGTQATPVLRLAVWKHSDRYARGVGGGCGAPDHLIIMIVNIIIISSSRRHPGKGGDIDYVNVTFFGQ